MDATVDNTAPPDIDPRSGGASRGGKGAFLTSRAGKSAARPGTDFKLRDYLRVLIYHYRVLLIVSLLPLAGTIAYTWFQPKRYRASATLIRVAEGNAARQSKGDTALRIALETVKGGDLTGLAEKHLGEMYKKEPLPGKVPEGPALAAMLEASVDARAGELTISAASQADSGIERESDQGKRVARVADAFAAALLEHIDNQRRTVVEQAEQAIQRRIKDKSGQHRKVLTDIFKRRAELQQDGEQFMPLPSEIEAVMSRLDGLKKMRQDAVFRDRELSKRLEQLNAAVEKAGGEVPGLDINDLKKALIQTEMALARAEIRYKPEHPTYKKRKGERDQLQEKVREHGGGTRTDLGRLQAQRDIVEAEQQGVRARRGTIDETIKDAKGKLDAVMAKLKTGDVDEKFAEMLRQRQVLEVTIASLHKRLEGMESSVSSPLPRLALLREAVAPASHYSPRWSINLAFGLGLAVLLVLFAAFIAENLEDRIRDQRDLMQHFDLPFLGPVPLWREGEPLLIDLDRPRAVIADVYGVLRNNIGYALPPGVPKVLLVASSVVGEGKSTIAANLAISYCLDGNNVLLIDTDLRRPRAHRLLERLCPQAGDSAGLSGYLAGRVGMEEILFQASVPGLSIISAGKGAVNPSKLLGSAEMRALIDTVVQSFDAVVLDGPAVLPVVDSTVVSRLASGVLLVVASKRAPAEQVSTAIARLEHVKAPIIGMVLNRQPGGSHGYYHYYGSRYGYGYGSGYGYSHRGGEEQSGTE